MAASKELNIAALAFIGDAVYEVYVRKHVMETGVAHSDVLHKMAVEYVSAEGQAKVIKALMEEELTGEEVAPQSYELNMEYSKIKR